MTSKKALILIAALAVALLGQACRKKTSADHWQDALRAAQRGDTIGVMVKCQKIIDMTPDDPVASEARMLLARCQMKSGDYQAERQTLTEVIERVGLSSPMGQGAYVSRLRSWEREKRPQDAIRQIEETAKDLEVAPNFARDVQLMLGGLYEANGESDKAKAHFAQLADAADDEAFRLQAKDRQVALHLKVNEFAECIALWEEYLDKHGDTEFRGIVLFSIGFIRNRLAENPWFLTGGRNIFLNARPWETRHVSA